MIGRVEKMFQFNYFLKMLIGNAIRLQTFSLINLTTSDPRGFIDPNFFTAWIVSLIFTAAFLGVALFNLYVVEKAKHKENGLDLLIEENPLVETLFTGLKSTS